jgi:nucleotide-binding universal stress UspA family protein
LISKILICIDGTDCAQRALEFGLDLAGKYSASVKILNVLETPIFGTPENPLANSAGMAGFVKDLRKVHEEMLIRAAEEGASLHSGLKISTELKEGNPPEQIVATAAEGNFDVVVVGHGSNSRIREFFLGGTSERVAHLARSAVFIVK